MIARLLPTTSTAARTIDKEVFIAASLRGQPDNSRQGSLFLSGASISLECHAAPLCCRKSATKGRTLLCTARCLPPQRQPLGLPAAPSPGSALAGAVFLGGNVERAVAVSTIDTNQREDGLVNGGPLLGQLFSAFARQHCPGFRHILQLFLMNLVPDSQSHFAALGSVIFVFRCFSHGRDPNNRGQKNVNPNNRFRRKSTGERRAFISSKFGMLVKYTIPLLTGDLHANGRRLSRFVQCF